MKLSGELVVIKTPFKDRHGRIIKFVGGENMDVLKEKRLEKNMTLEDVGKLVGVGKSTVRKWENGMIENMGRDKIVSLSKALDISPLEILGMNEQEIPKSNTSFKDLENKEVMANNINHYMKKYGIDRKKLSSDLGISYTTLTDWIKGKTYPRIDKIEMLANYFNISKSDLVENKSEEKNLLIEKTLSTMKKIDDEKKQKVYDFAQKQLEIQTNERITSISKTNDEEIYTLAAHSPDPNREYSEEDIEHIQSVLAKYRKKYEDKNKK
ncbi:transcriptional regulator [Enterococcus hirae]|nr:transcriptional regulator [Enterococcus hirae]EMF0405208.1 transcriptional regulator [Enterococcus hirae]EMF0421060.1 transcriptional regulator [Enterococcus hirae]EMF0513630.1 transcriptional regulator [Enterococcus hirae]